MAATTMASLPSTIALLTLVVMAPALSELANSKALPGCQASCGDVDIPYPFGVGANCFRQAGFEIRCKGTTPFIANTEYKVLNISVAASVASVQLPIAWACYDESGNISRDGNAKSIPSGVYRISAERNEFVVIGCSATAFIRSQQVRTLLMDRYVIKTGCMASCLAAESAVDGQCVGKGCCMVKFPPGLADWDIAFDDSGNRNLSSCSYGFLVAKGDYRFRQSDLKMDVGTMMPVWLDWAIRPPVNDGTNLTCAEAEKNGPSYACKSPNSNCVDAVPGPGYSCLCREGYEGNPYIEDGCIDIDECMYPTYPCYGHCQNTLGSYSCTCARGYHSAEPKVTPCQPNFSREAQITIGVICGVAFIIILVIFKLMLHRQKRKLRDFFIKRNGGPMLENVSNIKIFTQAQLNQITKNYSIVLGKGGFGEVYMGTVDNNQQVAVKRSISVNEARRKEFANEVVIQSRISHRNVIKLIGCCLEVDVPMLVYEFAQRGSLYDLLHGTTDNNKIPLPLGTRLGIAADSAEALSYMHTSATQKILHGDVKSGNILLDANFMPKVSDFGTSRLLSIDKKHTNFVIGDINYIDPMYMKTGCLDEKSDVYSFGVVLLELITRKKPRYDGNNSLLTNFVKLYASDERAQEMLDAEIASPENIEFLEKVGSIAIACLKEDMDERPNMKLVAENLQLVRREWKQCKGIHGDQVADEISMEIPIGLTMNATGAETPGYSALLK